MLKFASRSLTWWQQQHSLHHANNRPPGKWHLPERKHGSKSRWKLFLFYLYHCAVFIFRYKSDSCQQMLPLCSDVVGFYCLFGFCLQTLSLLQGAADNNTTTSRAKTAVHSLIWKAQKSLLCPHTFGSCLDRIKWGAPSLKKLAAFMLYWKQQWLLGNSTWLYKYQSLLQDLFQ